MNVVTYIYGGGPWILESVGGWLLSGLGWNFERNIFILYFILGSFACLP
jgi:hypothetical protein